MASEALRYEELRGEELRPHLRELGELRIAVFRDYPYLYDGDLGYEAEYLEIYAKSALSLVVLLREGGRLVGATTCLPLRDESPEFQAPFLAAGIDLGEVFYFGESIILPPWRGRGTGAEFFRLREKHAREAGPFRYTAFCAVDRPDDHPRRPPGHRPLDAFWGRLGYEKRPGLACELSWKELDEDAPSPKRLTFWLKEWS